MSWSYVVDTTLQFAHKLMSNQMLFFTSFPRLSQKYEVLIMILKEGTCTISKPTEMRHDAKQIRFIQARAEVFLFFLLLVIVREQLSHNLMQQPPDFHTKASQP